VTLDNSLTRQHLFAQVDRFWRSLDPFLETP
jgi:hypothetical protein